jgi:hypothetical protein
VVMTATSRITMASTAKPDGFGFIPGERPGVRKVTRTRKGPPLRDAGAGQSIRAELGEIAPRPYSTNRQGMGCDDPQSVFSTTPM